MEQIIVAYSKISKTIFPCTIDSVEYGSLTDFVTKVTRNAEMPFSASLSNLDHRKTLVYTCTFSSSGCQAQLALTHSTDFYNNHLFTFDIQNCIFQHTNHLLNHHFVQCHRNCYHSEVCQEIIHQTILGVPPGRIRSNLNIESGSNIFYDIRREAINDQRHEDLDSLISDLERGKSKRIIVNKDNGVLISLTIVDNEILNSKYANDIAIFDDTAMTNMYGLPLEAVVVVDQENHTQLLGYSIIPNKSKESFELFCQDFLQLGGCPFRIIVVDRLESQFEALSRSFPDSFIAFCLVHIRRDLLSYFPPNDDIIGGFDMIKRNPLMSFKYLDYLKLRFSQMDDSIKGKKCIQILIDKYEHWLPFCLMQKGIYHNFDSSRIEGLFGLLKGKLWTR